MHLDLKSPTAILQTAFPVYIVFVVSLYIALRRARGGEWKQSMWATLIILAGFVHGFPLLVYVHGLLNNSLLNRAGTTSTAPTYLFRVFAVEGVLVTAAQSLLVLVPVWILFFVAEEIVRDRKIPLRIASGYATILIIILFSIYVPARIAYDASSISVDTRVFEVKKLPKSLDGFRIGILADIQLDENTRAARVREYVNLLNNERPDLILVAGDVATWSSDRRYLRRVEKELVRLEAPYGVMAVIGDHDEWVGRKEVRRMLIRNSIRVLVNSVEHISIRQSEVSVLGLTNIFSDRASDSTLTDVLTQKPDSGFAILLTHQMTDYIAERSSEYNVQLLVAGHTHGGQINFWFFGEMLAGSLLDSRYVSGYSTLGNTLVYICNGLGMSVFPFRYNATPSVGLIHLQRK